LNATSDVGGRPATKLKSDALPLSQIIMQAITSMGPALTVLVAFQPGIGLSGVNTPLVYLADVLVVLMLGSTLAQLSRLFPSAGGYYTYVSRTLHPRAGFIVGWAFVLYSVISPGVLFAFLGRMVSLTLIDYGIELSWSIPFSAACLLAGTILYRGIEFSGRSLLVIGLMEIGLVLVFSAWGFALPLDRSISFAPFDPRNISAGSFALAAVFGVFVYTGWESVSSLAEESNDPRRNIPVATIASILFNCTLMTLCTWGLLLSWGMHDIAGIVSDPAMPAITLAHRLWGPLWWLLLFAVANSIIGAGVGMAILSTRMWFAMGRVGALPHWFATVHPRYLTPLNATRIQIVLFFVVGFGAAAWFGIDNVYLVGGLISVFAAIIIYIAANVGLSYHMWIRHRSAFHWRQHGFYPTASTLILLILCYKSVVPLPAAPASWAPLIVAVWIVLGLMVILGMRWLGREEWLQRAAASGPGSSVTGVASGPVVGDHGQAQGTGAQE
jgi:amino acid transporter